MRYSGSENPVLVGRRHSSLQRALPDVHVPNEAEEVADPGTADNVYDTCVRWLLEQTRDQKKFVLLFDENCNYGFRRNLWGMKPAGVFLSVLGLALGASGIFVHTRAHAEVSPISYGGAACIMALLAFWVVWCRPEWVKLSLTHSPSVYLQRLTRARP